MTVERCLCLPIFAVKISPSYPAYITLVASKERWTCRCGPQCASPPVQGSTFGYSGHVRRLAQPLSLTEHFCNAQDEQITVANGCRRRDQLNTKARRPISTSARLEPLSKAACSTPCRAASDWTMYERKGIWRVEPLVEELPQGDEVFCQSNVRCSHELYVVSSSWPSAYQSTRWPVSRTLFPRR